MKLAVGLDEARELEDAHSEHAEAQARILGLKHCQAVVKGNVKLPGADLLVEKGQSTISGGQERVVLGIDVHAIECHGVALRLALRGPCGNVEVEGNR